MRSLLAVAVVVLLLGSAAPAADDSLAEVTEAIQAGDYSKAVQLLQPLAEAGSPGAQQVLGGLYENGLGVAVDMTAAASWYRKAAEQGMAYSQFLIGDLLVTGKGGQRDGKLALEWYRKAAEQGLKEGEFRLGMLLQEGVLMGALPKPSAGRSDLKEASLWLGRAAAQGDTAAAARLNSIILEHPWEDAAKDAFTYVDARVAQVAVEASKGYGGRTAFLSLAPGAMIDAAWDQAHAVEVAGVVGLVASGAEGRLQSGSHAELPAALSATVAGDCRMADKVLERLEVDRAVLRQPSGGETPNTWFGAVQRDHIVLGTLLGEVDGYFELMTFYAQPFYGDWTGREAVLWNPTRTCSIVLRPPRVSL